MAVLAKIRQRSILLILIIALALFSFVLADLIQSGGFNRESNNVGSVNGEDISYQEFRLTVDNVQKNMSNKTSAIGAVNYVWDEEVKKIIIKEQYEKLGLRVGEDHIIKIMQEDQNIGQNPMFLNETGQFDIKKFKAYVASIGTMGNDQWNAWKKYEEQVEKIALERMYFNLINAGIGTTINEAKLSYKLENDKVDFEYVAFPIANIKDTEVSVSNSEIESYIKKNENKFKAPASKNIDYVLIEEKASAEDIAEVNKKMNEILNGKQVFDAATNSTKTIPAFKDATNVEEFVNMYSDVKYDSTYISKNNLPAGHQDQIFNLQVNGIYGPFEFNGYSYITRLLSRKPNAQVKASHVLLAYVGAMRANPNVKRTKEEAKAKADELFKQVSQNPESFAMVAATNSDDSSAGNGGDLGYFSEGMMVKPFNDFVFNNAVGKIGIVETDFGYHVIKVTEKQDAVRLATIGLQVEASEATSDKVYNTVSNFEMKATEGDFNKVAKEMKLDIKKAENIKVMDEYVNGIGENREIVKWIFGKDSEIGSVKKFDIPNGFIVAKITSEREEGLQTAKEAEGMVKPILIQKKKLALAKAKLKGDFATIQKQAGILSGVASNLSVNNAYIQNIGQEAKVVAAALNSTIGKESEVIEGQNGVFKIKTIVVNKAPELPEYSNYAAKEKSKRGDISGQLYNALKKNADIKDNRHLFY